MSNDGGVLSHFQLRPLTAADQAFLWEMLYHAVHVPEGAAPPAREIVRRPELARYAEGWGRAGDLGLVAVDEATGRPVGVAWLRLLTGAQRGYGCVDDDTPELSVAVLPGYRGRGIGTRLLKALLAAAEGRYRAVSLSVSRGNPALALYERLGFAMVAEDEDSMTMVWGAGQGDAEDRRAPEGRGGEKA